MSNGKDFPEWEEARRNSRPEDPTQAKFVELLEQPIASSEAGKLAKRKQELQQLVDTAPLANATRLDERLSNPKDALARFFKYELSTPLRNDLKRRLDGRKLADQRGTDRDNRGTWQWGDTSPRVVPPIRVDDTTQREEERRRREEERRRREEEERRRREEAERRRREEEERRRREEEERRRREEEKRKKRDEEQRKKREEEERRKREREEKRRREEEEKKKAREEEKKRKEAEQRKKQEDQDRREEEKQRELEEEKQEEEEEQRPARVSKQDEEEAESRTKDPTGENLYNELRRIAHFDPSVKMAVAAFALVVAAEPRLALLALRAATRVLLRRESIGAAGEAAARIMAQARLRARYPGGGVHVFDVNLLLRKNFPGIDFISRAETISVKTYGIKPGMDLTTAARSVVQDMLKLYGHKGWLRQPRRTAQALLDHRKEFEKMNAWPSALSSAKHVDTVERFLRKTPFAVPNDVAPLARNLFRLELEKDAKLRALFPELKGLRGKPLASAMDDLANSRVTEIGLSTTQLRAVVQAAEAAAKPPVI